MIEWVRREAIYLWYYLDKQVRQIAPYWALGILLGWRRYVINILFTIALTWGTGKIVNLIL